ncbi:hypothetical protein ACLOJK_036368 [Asimina triloba]
MAAHNRPPFCKSPATVRSASSPTVGRRATPHHVRLHQAPASPISMIAPKWGPNRTGSLASIEFPSHGKPITNAPRSDGSNKVIGADPHPRSRSIQSTKPIPNQAVHHPIVREHGGNQGSSGWTHQRSIKSDRPWQNPFRVAHRPRPKVQAAHLKQQIRAASSAPNMGQRPAVAPQVDRKPRISDPPNYHPESPSIEHYLSFMTSEKSAAVHDLREPSQRPLLMASGPLHDQVATGQDLHLKTNDR